MENTRGSLLMVAAMAAFAIEDALVKWTAGLLPVGEVIAVLGLTGTLVFATLARLRGEPVFTRALLTPPVILRSVGELVGTVGYVTAVVFATLSAASAILQALPLAVTLGAALFLGESVHWRRWSAIAVGLVGVLLVLQPGMDGFTPMSLFAVVGVAGLALRDTAVRKVPRATSSAQLATWAFVAVFLAGVLMMCVMGTPPVAPSPAQLALLLGACTAGISGYYALVAATRIGDVSVVVLYRYIRLLFAIILGVLVFGESPNALTLAGATLIVGAGLFTMWREGRKGKQRTVSP